MPTPTPPQDDDLRPLIKAARQGDPRNSDTAIRLLGESGNRQAIAPLIRALKNRSYVDRTAAVKALQKIGDPAATPYVAAALLRPVSRRERYAVGAFMEIRKTHAACIAALVSFGTSEAIDAIKTCIALNESDSQLSWEVRRAKEAVAGFSS